MTIIQEADQNSRRAKIKLLAKKSIETGEDCDAIPESMRQYLAIQAMESGKSLGGNFLGRGGLSPYGGGSMLMGGDQNPQGKVGMLSWLLQIHDVPLTGSSHSSFVVPFAQCWFMETYWSKCYGFDHLLLT